MLVRSILSRSRFVSPNRESIHGCNPKYADIIRPPGPQGTVFSPDSEKGSGRHQSDTSAQGCTIQDQTANYYPIAQASQISTEQILPSREVTALGSVPSLVSSV
jgi:hypothetical protein